MTKRGIPVKRPQDTAKCTYCGFWCKGQRGLRQHQNTNTACRTKQVRLERRNAGYGYFLSRKSFVQVYMKVSDTPPEQLGQGCFIPYWSMELIHVYAQENYNSYTSLSQRKGPRWTITERLVEEYNRVKDNARLKSALTTSYRLREGDYAVENSFIVHNRQRFNTDNTSAEAPT